MQEQGRREDAAKRKEPQPHKRPEGVGAPSTATLPTMDIEKPAPAGSVHPSARKASYTPPRHRDEIDNVLAENGVGSDSSSTHDGLGSVLGGPSHPSARAKHARRHARAHAKHRRR
jgi:hypothetical protein